MSSLRSEFRSQLSRRAQEVVGLRRMVEEMVNNLAGFNNTKDSELISNIVAKKINTEISSIIRKLSEIEIKGRFSL